MDGQYSFDFRNRVFFLKRFLPLAGVLQMLVSIRQPLKTTYFVRRYFEKQKVYFWYKQGTDEGEKTYPFALRSNISLKLPSQHFLAIRTIS